MSFNLSNASDSITNPLSYFSERGEDYEKYRPIHPDSAIDAILSGLESPTRLVAADIGAGTASLLHSCVHSKPTSPRA